MPGDSSSLITSPENLAQGETALGQVSSLQGLEARAKAH